MRTDNFQLVTFGAGCFWHVEEEFLHLRGVKSTAVGSMGGRVENPSYERVCQGDTGHAEAVQIQYDPSEVSYDKLLGVFWMIHEPTVLYRQDPDIGHQYRSVIFYHTPEQKTAAEKSKEELGKSGKYKTPIVTEIVPASTFWKAEEYHQQYFHKTGLRTCGVPLSKPMHG